MQSAKRELASVLVCKHVQASQSCAADGRDDGVAPGAIFLSLAPLAAVCSADQNLQDLELIGLIHLHTRTVATAVCMACPGDGRLQSCLSGYTQSVRQDRPRADKLDL